MADKRNITIAGGQFEVTVPFETGHTCTEAEAKVLNQSRSEAVRNNTAKKVKELLAEGNEAEAKKVVAEYDAAYEFTLQSAGTSRTVDPIDREAKKIARELIRAKIAENGQKWGDYDKEALNAKILEYATTNEKIRKSAEKRVREQNKALEELADITL